jgi:hypothetical protein
MLSLLFLFFFHTNIFFYLFIYLFLQGLNVWFQSRTWRSVGQQRRGRVRSARSQRCWCLESSSLPYRNGPQEDGPNHRPLCLALPPFEPLSTKTPSPTRFCTSTYSGGGWLGEWWRWLATLSNRGWGGDPTIYIEYLFWLKIYIKTAIIISFDFCSIPFGIYVPLFLCNLFATTSSSAGALTGVGDLSQAFYIHMY